MILLFLFRSSIPAFKYPFIVLYLGFIFNCVVVARKGFINSLKNFIKHYFLIISLAAIFFIAITLSQKLFLEVFKDSLNILILISFLFILDIIIESKEELKLLISNLTDCIIWFSVIISLFGLYENFRIYFSNNIITQSESSLVDYNFALLPIFFGIVSVFSKLAETNLRKEIVMYNLFLSIQSLQIFFSNSRRGFFIINIIIIILFLGSGLAVVYKNKHLGAYAKSCRYYLIIVVLFFIIFFLFVFATSYSFKEKVLEISGMKRINIFQKDITERCFRYYSILDKNTSYSSFYRKIWSPVYDAKDPDSGWGTRTHKTVFPLSGENVDIVPPGVKGYLMDNTCNPYVADGNTYSYTDLNLYNLKVRENDTVYLSVYCYVSKDFNGDWALIALTNNNSPWIGSTFYDFERKGTWQKLSLTKNCKNGEISAYLYFCKKGVTDFGTLKGYVIFAYPECKIITRNDISNATMDSHMDVKKESGIESLNVCTGTSFIKKPTESSFGVIFRFSDLLTFQDRDLIRRWASKVIVEDTTYTGYEANIIIDTIKDSFLDLRYVRWQFAWQIFLKEYGFWEKTFGDGFNFLNWYGYYFLKDKTKTDYPHNPFLYILLYSGLIGVVLYIIFLYKVFNYYIKYLKEYYLIFIFFLITFFFTFFSGGNPFDPPIMGFFVILPFFIHAIHRKDKAEPVLKNQINNQILTPDQKKINEIQ